MTVAELIRELQAMPNQHAPVRMPVDLSGDEDQGPDVLWSDVVAVIHEGPYVALEHR
jgi:hypothetical protein